MRRLVWPQYHARRNVMVLDAPGASWNGTASVAPGLGPPSVTGARSTQAPSVTSFQAMVNASNQPPRNNAWFTFTPGSLTVADNEPSSQGLSLDAPPRRMNPPSIARTACG